VPITDVTVREIHLQETRISKIFWGTKTRNPLLDPLLNTMNRAASCLMLALRKTMVEMKDLWRR